MAHRVLCCKCSLKHVQCTHILAVERGKKSHVNSTSTLKIFPSPVPSQTAVRCRVGVLSQKRALSDEIATQFTIMGNKITPATSDSMSI